MADDEDPDQRRWQPPTGPDEQAGSGLTPGDPPASGAEQAFGEPRPGDAGGAFGAPTSGGPLWSGAGAARDEDTPSSTVSGWAPPAGASDAGAAAGPPAPSGSGWAPPAGAGGQQTFPPYGSPPASGTNGKATASLVLGVLGVLFCPLILSVAALVLGYQARREIDAAQGRQTNRGVAIAGIVTGWIGLVFGVLIVLGLLLYGAQVEEGEVTFGEPALVLLALL